MDRVELGIKLDQINKLREKGEYADAAKVCDTIDWRKVRKWSELSVAQEVYEKAGRPKDSRNICVYAYNRSLGGKRLLFKLTELSIVINDLDEADDLYREFVETAPRDMERYILLYKLNKARGVSTGKLIDILEEYKQNELDEQYEYELAELYAEAGRTDDCIRECDDLILWFNEGEYVEKALRLKAKHAELTKSQKAKLRTMEEFRAAGFEYSSVLPAYETEPDVPEAESINPGYKSGADVHEDEIRVPEKDYSIYDTQNVQAELAKSMAAILEGIKQTDISQNQTAEPDIISQATRPIPSVRPTQSVQPIPPAQTMPPAQTGYANQPYAEPSLPDAYAKDSEYTEYTEDTAEQTAAASVTEAYEPDVADDADDAFMAIEPLDRETEFVPEPPSDYDEPIGLDEPTKEIRINTHHWKRYKSYMVDEENEAEASKAHSKRGLPKYLVHTSESEAESVTGPEFIIEDLETIIEGEAVGAPIAQEAATEESEIEEAAAPEAVAEPESFAEKVAAPEAVTEESEIEAAVAEQIAEEEAAAPEAATEESVVAEAQAETTAISENISSDSEEESLTDEPSVSESSESAPAATEPVESAVSEPAAPEPAASEEHLPQASAEEAADSEIIDGQIDLMSWLDGGNEEAAMEEGEPNAEPAAEDKPEPEAEPVAEDKPEAEETLPVIEEPDEETETDKSVEEVMDEMTRQLMAEVTQDIEEREKQKKPSSISEEEYIATTEEEKEPADEHTNAESADGDALKEEKEAYLAEAAAETAAAIAQEMPENTAPRYEDDGDGYGEDIEERRTDKEAASDGEQDVPHGAGNDYVLKASERKYLRQYLFMNGLEEQTAYIINSKKREVGDGTSSSGNIVILGKPNTKKKNFAIDLFKAMHAEDGAGSLKIARTTAAIINRNGIKASAEKIKGMTLIIEHAGQLTKASVEELCGLMAGDTGSMLVILTGEDYTVKRIFTENPDFGRMFDYRVEIRQYTVNEFVAMAKEYSRVKGYLITDRALLKLYLMVDGLASKENGAEIEDIRRIVDDAIEHCRKKPKKSGTLIRLKEKDFVE